MASSETDNPRSKMIAAPGRCDALAGELAQNAKAPHTGKLSKRPEGPPGFSIAQREFAPMLCQPTPSPRLYPTRKRASWAGTINLPRPRQPAMAKGTFLLCWGGD